MPSSSVLGRGAPLSEIKRAYRKLAFSVHPEVGDEPGETRFREAHEAYQALIQMEQQRPRGIKVVRAPDRSGHTRTMHAARGRPELIRRRRPVNVIDDFETVGPSVGEILDHIAQNFFGFHQKSHGSCHRLSVEIDMMANRSVGICVEVQSMEMIHIMTRHPETVHPDDTLAKAKEKMDAAGFRRLPVVKDGEVVGMLTERDLRAHAGYLESSKVNAAMSTPVISVGPNSTVQEATRLMLRHKVGGLPVMDSGVLVGIVTTIDMLRAFLEVVETFEKSRASS
jgi:CBS domain-containing protein